MKKRISPERSEQGMVKVKVIKSSAIVITVIGVAGVVLAAPFIFSYIDQRIAFLPFEPILGWLPAYDVSSLLFGVLYAAAVVVIYCLLGNTLRLLRGIQAVAVLHFIRFICLLLVPLSPPLDLVPLHDPFSQLFYPGNEPFTKDLFFSGHTATASLLCFAVPQPRMRWLFICIAIIVGCSVLVQHVHWTIDVIVAPFAAWAAWRLSAITLRWSIVQEQSETRST